MVIEGNLIYAATPFRMQNLVEKICDFIESKGHFPVNPLKLMPIERYNYKRHLRENIYTVCFGLVDICPELWIFGIGAGSLKEYLRAKESGKQIRSFVKKFDPYWEESSQKEKYKIGPYKDVVKEVIRLSK